MKFDHPEDEHIYHLASESNDQIGDVTSQLGLWAASVFLEGQYGEKDRAAMERYDGAQLFIVRENSDGIVMIRPFYDEDEHTRAWAMLDQAVGLSEAGVSDEEARAAIDAYLQAAVFTGVDENGRLLDGQGLSWSEAAQESARADVIGFITQNIEQIRAFQSATGHGWEQIGIDFNFTRNGQDVGFWDRDAGVPGEALSEASLRWGDVSVYVNEQGEMGFL